MQILPGLEPQMPQLSSKNVNNDNSQKDERHMMSAGCSLQWFYRLLQSP